METNIIAKIKYFPNSGTTNDVGGMISTTNKKNTWRLIKIDMDNVTWNKYKIYMLFKQINIKKKRDTQMLLKLF